MNGRVRVSKDHRKLLKKARADGWEITRTRNNHIKWRSPKGQVVIHSSSPSDHNADKNFLSQLRNAGLDV